MSVVGLVSLLASPAWARQTRKPQTPREVLVIAIYRYARKLPENERVPTKVTIVMRGPLNSVTRTGIIDFSKRYGHWDSLFGNHRFKERRELVRIAQSFRGAGIVSYGGLNTGDCPLATDAVDVSITRHGVTSSSTPSSSQPSFKVTRYSFPFITNLKETLAKAWYSSVDMRRIRCPLDGKDILCAVPEGWGLTTAKCITGRREVDPLFFAPEKNAWLSLTSILVAPVEDIKDAAKTRERLTGHIADKGYKRGEVSTVTVAGIPECSQYSFAAQETPEAGARAIFFPKNWEDCIVLGWTNAPGKEAAAALLGALQPLDPDNGTAQEEDGAEAAISLSDALARARERVKAHEERLAREEEARKEKARFQARIRLAMQQRNARLVIVTKKEVPIYRKEIDEEERPRAGGPLGLNYHKGDILRFIDWNAQKDMAAVEPVWIQGGISFPGVVSRKGLRPLSKTEIARMIDTDE